MLKKKTFSVLYNINQTKFENSSQVRRAKYDKDLFFCLLTDFKYCQNASQNDKKTFSYQSHVLWKLNLLHHSF